MKWPRLDGYLPEGMERDYRLYHLKDDQRVAFTSMGILTILLVAFAYNDYVLFGFAPTFYYLVALRSIYLVYNIGLMVFLWNNRNPAKFDWNLFVWLILSGVMVTAINLTRPPGYIGNVPIDVILILIIYLGIPIRLIFRAIGGLLFLLVESLDLAVFHGQAAAATYYASVVGLLLANIVGIYASSRLYSFRRSEFKARMEKSRTLDLLNQTGKMASVGGWEFDVKTRRQKWTDEVYLIHELEPGQQMTVEDGIKYYAPEAVPVISEAIQHAVIFGEPFDLELPIITAKGNRRWVHAVGRAYTENGLITKVGGTFQDITASQEAKDIIKREAEQWQATFDAISDLVSIQDKDFRLVRVNKAYADAFLVRPEELIGKHCYEIVHNSTGPIPNCPHEQALKCKSSVTEEVFEPLLGIHMEVSCSPIFNDKGELEGTVHIVKDITERKQAEEKLRESERQYREMLDFLPISVFEIDNAARIVSFNQTALKAFGYSQEDQIVGMSAFQFFSPEELQRVGENLGKVIEGTSIPGDEYIFVRKDGSKFTGLIYATSVIRQNKLAGVRGAVVDITKYKQTEELLRESEAQLGASLEIAPDGVYMSDLKGTFLYGNRRAEEIIGYKREELIGKNYLELNLLPKNDQAKALELLQANINGKATGPDEFELIAKSGRSIPVEINTSLLQIKGQTTVLGFVRDVTERKKLEEERQKAAERIQDLYNNAPAGYHSLDKDGVYVQVNDTELAWLGYARDEVIGKMKFSDMLRPESREDFVINFPLFKQRGWLKDVEAELVRKDGTIMPVLVSATALKDEDGNFLMSRTTMFDITEVKRLQKIVAESDKRFRTILEEMNDSYFELDLEGNFTFVNNALCRVLIVTKEEIIGKNFRSITSVDDVDSVVAAFRRTRDTSEPNKGLIFKLTRKDGVTEFAEVSISPQKDEQGNVTSYHCVGRNVTERIELQNKLTAMAMHDALTGLPNRSLLYDRYNVARAQAQRNNRKLAVMGLDLDHFKAINDTLGHAAGDKLLKATADRLTSLVRKSDTVARLGGDEFVVLLLEFSNIKDVLKTAQKIVTAFQKPFIIDRQELFVTTSIGIAIFPRDGSNIEELLKAADTAMYYTKEHGRNNYKMSYGAKASAR